MVFRKIFINLGISLLLSSPLLGVTLNLTPTTGIPTPAGTHIDAYEFPIELLEPFNPITRMSITYIADNAGPANHAIVSATPLFDGSQVVSVDVTTQTLNLYEAEIIFAVPVTDVSSAFDPAFAAVHEEINDLSTTQLYWTAFYLDGSERSNFYGIIPEPSSAILNVMACFAFAVRRRR